MTFEKKKKRKKEVNKQLLVANTSHFLLTQIKAGKNTDDHEIT